MAFGLRFWVKLFSLSLFFFKEKFYSVFGSAGSSWLHGLSLATEGRATLVCLLCASHCDSFSHCGAWAPGAWASSVAVCRLSSCGSWALESRLSGCGAQVLLLGGMWEFF